MRVRLFVTLVTALLIGSVAMADCGKIVFIQVSPQVMQNPQGMYLIWWQALPFGGSFVMPQAPVMNMGLGALQQPQAQQPPTPDPSNIPQDTTPTYSPPVPQQMTATDPPAIPPAPAGDPPAPCAADDLAANIPSGDASDPAETLGLFEEPKQMGLIAWNGVRELLAIRTDEMTVTKGGYMSILPLAGKPTGVKVKEGKNTMWNVAENFFVEAFKHAGESDARSEDLGLELETKIGPHEIFIWKIDNFKDFFTKIQHYLIVRYKGKAVPLIPKDLERIMKDYFKKGYTYFAFDVVPETGTKLTKQTILYEFETPKHELFYPLVISQSGGKGNTDIDLLIVCDKEHLTYPDHSARSVVVEQFKNHFVKFLRAELTHAHVGRIAPEMATMFPDKNRKIYARWYETKGKTDIRSFKDDFRLKDAPEVKSPGGSAPQPKRGRRP